MVPITFVPEGQGFEVTKANAVWSLPFAGTTVMTPTWGAFCVVMAAGVTGDVGDPDDVAASAG
jgi:hypothetical protein